MRLVNAINRIHKSSTSLWLLLAALVLGACGKVLPVHYYDLRYPQAAIVKADPKHAATLAVAAFTAPSVYRQNRILYREGAKSAQVGFYEDRRWIAPPTELLTQATLLHFRNSGLFANVIPYSDMTSADFVLRCHVNELDEIDLIDGYYARIGIQAELAKWDAKSGVIWSGPINVSRKTTMRDAHAIINEMAQGVEEALTALSAAVDQAVSRSRTVPRTP